MMMMVVAFFLTGDAHACLDPNPPGSFHASLQACSFMPSFFLLPVKKATLEPFGFLFGVVFISLFVNCEQRCHLDLTKFVFIFDIVSLFFIFCFCSGVHLFLPGFIDRAHCLVPVQIHEAPFAVVFLLRLVTVVPGFCVHHDAGYLTIDS